MARRLLSYRLSEILDECKKSNGISGAYFQRKYKLNYESSQKIVKLLIEKIVINENNPKISEIINFSSAHHGQEKESNLNDDLNDMKDLLKMYKKEISETLKDIDKSKDRLEKILENIENAL